MIRRCVVFVVLCFLFAGCANDVPAESPEGQDAQNQFMFTGTFSFQETEGFYCGNSFLGDYLNYYDKASGISGVLCADPSCAHDSNACGAYMEEGATLSVYDGRLYWIAPENGGRDKYLWCSDLSGINREKVKRLSFEDVIIKYQPQWYVVHRGKLYILGNTNTVNGTQSSTRDTLVSTPLDDSEEFTVLYERVSDLGQNTMARFVGNYAYISTITFPLGGPCDVTVTKLDLTTGDPETVYMETKIPASLDDSIWVTKQGEIYLTGADDSCAYVWKIEDGKRVEIGSWPGTEPSIPYVMDGIAVYLSRPDGVRLAEIINLNGETVYSGLLFPEGIPGLEGDINAYSFALVGGDRDKLILNLQNHAEGGLFDYTILLDLNNDLMPTILWSGSM